MKLRDQLLFPTFSKQNLLEKGSSQKKKKTRKKSFKKDEDLLQPLYKSPFSSGSSTSSSQLYGSNLSTSSTHSTKPHKASSRCIVVDNIMYNADADGCLYEDQPNHNPILQAPSYKILKSSLITTVAPPTAISPVLEQNVLRPVEVAQATSEAHCQCFNCGEKGHVYDLILCLFLFTLAS
jgi:hypothetical protein